MSGPSYVRIETFARTRTTQPHRASGRQRADGTTERTWTVSEMVGELVRRPENSPHVTKPRAPDILFGLDPNEVASRAIAMAEQGSDSRGRAVKRDAKIITSIVASWPEPWQSVKARPDGVSEVQAWSQRFVRFVEREFPGRVGSVVLHWDEARPNVHALIQPELRPMQTASGREILHFSIEPADPLRSAARKAKQRGANGRHAAAIAGTAFQARYARDVGYPSGMTRGDGAAGPRVARSEALLRARMRDETATLRMRIEELERENARLGQAAVIAAAVERRQRARFGPDGPPPAAKLTDPVRVAALLRISDGHAVRRIDANGVIHSGGPPAKPGEQLRPDRKQLDRIESDRGSEAALGAYRGALHDAAQVRDALLNERDEARARAAGLEAQMDAERNRALVVRTEAENAIEELRSKLRAAEGTHGRLVGERNFAVATLAVREAELQTERRLREAAETLAGKAAIERSLAIRSACHAKEEAAALATAVEQIGMKLRSADEVATSSLTALRAAVRDREKAEAREAIFARQLNDAFDAKRSVNEILAREQASRREAERDRDRALGAESRMKHELNRYQDHASGRKAPSSESVSAGTPKPPSPVVNEAPSSVVVLCQEVARQLGLAEQSGREVQIALAGVHRRVMEAALDSDYGVEASARDFSTDFYEALQTWPDATKAWASLHEATAEAGRSAMLLQLAIGDGGELGPPERSALKALSTRRDAVAAMAAWLPLRGDVGESIARRVRRALHPRLLQPSHHPDGTDDGSTVSAWSAGLGAVMAHRVEFEQLSTARLGDSR